jgi:hypothetical protein
MVSVALTEFFIIVIFVIAVFVEMMLRAQGSTMVAFCTASRIEESVRRPYSIFNAIQELQQQAQAQMDAAKPTFGADAPGVELSRYARSKEAVVDRILDKI